MNYYCRDILVFFCGFFLTVYGLTKFTILSFDHKIFVIKPIVVCSKQNVSIEKLTKKNSEKNIWNLAMRYIENRNRSLNNLCRLIFLPVWYLFTMQCLIPVHNIRCIPPHFRGAYCYESAALYTGYEIWPPMPKLQHVWRNLCDVTGGSTILLI